MRTLTPERIETLLAELAQMKAEAERHYPPFASHVASFESRLRWFTEPVLEVRGVVG